MLKFFLGLVSGFVLAASLLFGLRAAAFKTQSGEQISEALILVAANNLKSHSGIVYVGADGKDLSGDDYVQLETLIPNRPIRPFSERPTSEDTCDSPLPEGLLHMGACKKDDYVLVSNLDNPLGHVMRVGVQTAACGGESLLVRWLGRWLVLDERLICT